MREINPKLKQYIEANIFPEYEKNEKGHGIGHIQDVIQRSFRLISQNHLTVDPNIVYTVCAYHDIGHHIDAKQHEKISAEMMAKDKHLPEFFTEEERKIIQEAIEDHRASSNHEPRSIYGKLVSSADRNNTVELCLERSYRYGKKHLPGATEQELYERAYDALLAKFGEGGYAKFYFHDEDYEKFLTDIRQLLQNKENFCKVQAEYIEKLKQAENANC